MEIKEFKSTAYSVSIRRALRYMWLHRYRYVAIDIKKSPFFSVYAQSQEWIVTITYIPVSHTEGWQVAVTGDQRHVEYMANLLGDWTDKFVKSKYKIDPACSGVHSVYADLHFRPVGTPRVGQTSTMYKKKSIFVKYEEHVLRVEGVENNSEGEKVLLVILANGRRATVPARWFTEGGYYVDWE